MSKKKLSNNEIKVKLTEYEQANEFYRHHDVMAWQIGAIFITASFLLLAYAADIGKHHLPLAIASILLQLTWIGMFTRMSDYTKIRKKRINKIEEILNMNHHRMVAREDKQQQKKLRYKIVRINNLKWMLLIGTVIAWLALTYNIWIPIFLN